MKKILSTSDYVFTAASKTIDFSLLVGFDAKRVMAVINTTFGQTLIYATGGGLSSPTGGSFSGSILTLVYDTTSMANSDNLQIIYDVQAGVEDARSTVDVVTGKFGADFNLLNSSFGGEIGSVLPSVSPDNALSVAVLNGGILSAPAMNVNDELIVDVTQSGSVPVVVGNTVSSLIVDGGGSALIGQQVSASSIPVVLPSDASLFQDLYIVGQAAQTAIINNILSVTSGATAIDANGYKSASVQVVSTGTAGNFVFEGSNDNVNFASIPVYNQIILTGTPIVTAITATASQIIYTFPVQTRYIRLRIGATITGGSIRAYTRLSQTPFSPAVFQMTQATAANLNATVAGSLTTVSTVTTVSAVTAAALAATTTTDIASAAITTTTTSANVATTNMQSVAFQFTVTANSGTNQTLDIVIQETFNGVDYYDIFHVQRITANGFYQTPLLQLTGIGIRYVRTVGGITPSFTMSGVRITRQVGTNLIKAFINRTVNPNTLNSATPAYFVDGCDEPQLVASLGAGGSGSQPHFALQGSEDGVNNWYVINGTDVTANTSTTVHSNPLYGHLPKYIRAVTSNAGSSGYTLNYITIRCKG
jgi:hypothetical protein